MSKPLEDYALIGDLETAALVAKDGSIDWLCLPRFDSPSCFAALIGEEENGFWRVAPAEWRSVSRRYIDGSLVLETRFVTDSGVVRLTDFMPQRNAEPGTSIVRIVEGESGSVDMRSELAIRFDYGMTVPWVRRQPYGLSALSGPNALALETPAPLAGRDYRTYSTFRVSQGDKVPFILTYRDSLDPPNDGYDATALCKQTVEWWRNWASSRDVLEEWHEPVLRSLITLKALIHEPSGGIIAAPTTSLPETLGGERNWDYRFCWLRDATFTLYSLMQSGLSKEASEWRDWLLRVAAGKPSQLQTLYSPRGTHFLPEVELDWLQGYEGSRPVRVGNQAHRQLQLDIYGEIMDAFHLSRRVGIKESKDSWTLQKALMKFVESDWRTPDNGIWEVRGPRRHFTHSKVLAWVAVDRAVRAVETAGLDGPLDRWRRLRKEIHEDVCAHGFDTDRNAFVQYYGTKDLDASLLMIPLVGFLPPSDPRVIGTVAAIEKELLINGFVQRYTPHHEVDGLGSLEGAFLPCTFWLADNYALMGRRQSAVDLFERLLAIRNDVGLLAEEYDAKAGRMVGNFPQAFSHVSLINAARNLTSKGPARHRSEDGGESGSD
jgi:GH15 family glucan-1,4-alpha-glucosidase